MKPKNFLAALAIGYFGVAFLRNGTAGKLVKIGANGAQVFTGGSAKLARRI